MRCESIFFRFFRWPVLLGLALVLAGCSGGLREARHAGNTAAAAEPLILVAGASGRVGHHVAARLRDDGRPFRALTRDAGRAIERWGPKFREIDWVEGDVRDAARMNEIMVDIDLVICVIGSRDIEGPNSAEFVDYGGVRNLVDAAVEHGVNQFVLLTAIGVTDKKHPFNRFSKGALEWRFKGENYLRASGLNYTIVRPGGLVDEPAGRQGLAMLQGDNWKPLLRRTLSREDLALVLIAALANPDAYFKTFEIVNDAELPPGAWRGGFAVLLPDSPRSP